jgi:hypothetical protein
MSILNLDHLYILVELTVKTFIPWFKSSVYLWFILLKNYNIDLVSSKCTGWGVVLAIFLRFLSDIFKKQSRNLCFTPLLFCMNHNDLPTK